MEYLFTKISRERLPDLLGVFTSAFGRSPSRTALETKHDTAFAGIRDLGFIAYTPADQPVAFYGIFPVEARVGGQLHLVAQSGDTMVHKAHEGKGLFTRLARVTYDDAKEKGIESVFGFPSASSYPGFVKRLEWRHHHNFHRYQFLVPTVPVSELLWRYGLARSVLAAWQRLLLKAFPAGRYFPGSLMDSGADCIARTDGYWAYKLASETVIPVRVSGVDVLLKLEGSLGIGDMDTLDPEILRAIIHRLRLYCFFAGIGRIRTYLSPGSPLDGALSGLARPTAGLPIGYVDFSPDVSVADVKYCYMDMDSF